MSLPTLSFPSSVDSTMLSTFDSCPQKFLMEFVLKRVPIGRSIHLHAGGVIASTLEHIRINFYKHGKSLDQCLVDAWPVFVQQWGDFDVPEKETKDFVNCWTVIEAYLKEYPPATDYFQPYIKSDGEPAVEFKFAIPTNIMHPETGDPIVFSGRTDMLCAPQDGSNTVYVMDEKTTKAMGTSWQYQWNMRGQFYGYTYAARAMGYPAVGALVRGMAIQQTQFQFAEKPLIFSDWQLEVWWQEMHKKLVRMVGMYENAKINLELGKLVNENVLWDVHRSFDKSFGEACQSYGGCIYVDLCTHPEPWLVYSDYEERVWDPLAKDPAAKSEDRLSQMGKMSWKDFLGEAS